MFKRGDGVITTKALGMLGDVPSGSFGVVQEAGFLGDYTVQVIPGDRVLHGVRGSDLTPATDLPWWAQRAPQRQVDIEDAPLSVSTPPRDGVSVLGWLVRLVVAGLLVLMALYGLSAWT